MRRLSDSQERHRPLPRGQAFDLSMLGALGISRCLAVRYVQEGRLMRLAQGVYAHPGEDVPWHGAIGVLQRRTGGVHVGGKSALLMHGIGRALDVGQPLNTRDPIVLWGRKPIALPVWVRARYPVRYVSAPLFSWFGQELNEQTLTTVPGQPEGLRVSVPERAVLEMLYEVGTRVGTEEARDLFNRLRSPRKALMGPLLFVCTSKRAAHLFSTWAGEAFDSTSPTGPWTV